MRDESLPLPNADNRTQSQIIKPGHNAWRTAVADRLSVLVDGQAYFRVLEGVLKHARHEIWIIGWDFNPDIPIRPDQPGSPTLGVYLLRLVEERPDLTIRVLVWGMGPIYSGKSLRMFRKRRWSSHPRIVLAFDNRHPLRGSHHQKLVVVDDRVAFVGGIDLTAKRWDTTDHAVDDPRRVLPSGERYDPVHDMQVALEGDAARLAGDIARRRWQFATDEAVPASDVSHETRLDGAAADMTNVTVAFARTEPAIPIASRSGRTTNQPQSRQKKQSTAHASAATSSSRTSTTFRSARSIGGSQDRAAPGLLQGLSASLPSG